MNTKLSLVLLVTMLIVPGSSGSVSAQGQQENGSGASQLNTEVQILEKRIQEQKGEFNDSESAAAYQLLQSDLDKANAEFTTNENRLQENQDLKDSKEEKKTELEIRLKIREQQLQTNPTNTVLQNEITVIKEQLNGEDGSGGLNMEMGMLDERMDEDQKKLDEITGKRDSFQNQFDTHLLTQKNKELQTAQNQLHEIKEEIQRNRMIKALHDMNHSVQSFSVKKYLSVGREAEIDLFSQDGKSNGFIDHLIRFLLQALGTFAVLMLIVGGYFLIVSEGDENRIQKGKNILFYTVLGLILAFSGYILVQAILSVLFQ